MRIEFDKSKIRGVKSSPGTGETIETFDINKEIAATAERIQQQNYSSIIPKKIMDNPEYLYKLLYPSWKNLDSGTLQIYSTDSPKWFKFEIVNKDFPGVAILEIEKVIKTLTEISEKMKV